MLFLDIETEPNPEALQYLPEPKPPKNYKDPDKIAAYIENKRGEQIKKAALDPDFGMITAAAVNAFSKTVGWLVNERRSEKDLLKSLWASINYCDGCICGYNVIDFDLPYIIRRSFALGIKPTKTINLKRYQTQPVLDLMQLLANWNREKYKSLKFICRRYGIANPLPEMDGSQYAEMEPEIKLAYVKNDVDMTVDLYQRMIGYYF